MFEIVSLYTMTLSSTTGDIKKMLQQNDLIEGEDYRVGIVSQSVIRNVSVSPAHHRCGAG